MIPKKIHYCWFGGNPLPQSAQKCIESWKKFLPDYEIVEWNESNFDVSFCKYCEQAYKLKKWAFVSDVARYKILYENGGVYFDTDVEIIKPLDDIIERGPFMGVEYDRSTSDSNDALLTKLDFGLLVAPGLGLASNPRNDLIRELLVAYDERSFINDDGSMNLKTIVQYTTETLIQHGLKEVSDIQCIEGISIYPKDYFSPKHPVYGTLNITENTRTIHHYDGSWFPAQKKIKKKITKIMGPRLSSMFVRIKHFFKQR